MRHFPAQRSFFALALGLALTGRASIAGAQEPASREAVIEQQQEEKAAALTPAEPGKAEQYVRRLSNSFLTATAFHAFWENAYSGGGFTLGAGYLRYVSPYNTLDVRGSITFIGYKRLEAEFIAPELFRRRGKLSVLGGWREATQVGFYGIGMTSAQENRANYRLQAAVPRRRSSRYFRRDVCSSCAAASRSSQWKQGPATGDVPSVEQVYTPRRCPASARSRSTCTRRARSASTRARRRRLRAARRILRRDRPRLHRPGRRVRLQRRSTTRRSSTSRSCARRGCCRFTRLAQTTYDKSGQQIPFFMLPSLGGGSDLRGYSSWRFRDLNSLLLQAEWRVMVNRFLDMALFYDAGKVAARRSDLASRRPEERLRPRLPLPRPGGDAAAHRADARATKASCSCFAASQVF